MEEERLNLYIENDQAKTKANAEALARQIAADMNQKLPEGQKVTGAQLEGIVGALLSGDLERQGNKEKAGTHGRGTQANQANEEAGQQGP